MPTNPQRRWVFLLVAGTVVLGLLAAACGGSAEEVAEAPGQEEPAEDAHAGAMEDPVAIPEDAQLVEVMMTELAFDPADITVEAGRPVAVRVHNMGAIGHDWTLHSADGHEIAHIHAMPGEEATGVFTLEPGTYEAWCTVPGHKEGGMSGTVVAE